MSRLLLTLVVAVGTAGGAFAGAQDFFSETTKDFGTTPRGPVLTHYFPVRNTGTNTVTLGQPRVSCGCVSASIVGKTTLAPGESTSVLAQMDTRRIPQAGVLKSVIVYVSFLSPYSEEVQLRVQTIARDDLVMSPDTIAMGTVRKGQGGKSSTRVTFHSDANWKLTEATSTGAYVKVDTKEVSRKGNEVSYDVTATLDPECPVGNWTADLWVKTSAVGVEKLRIPVTVNVVAPIVVNPEAVKFGDVKVGEKAEQKVILQGSQPFKITAVKGAEGDLEIVQVAEGSRPVHILKLTFAATKAGAADWSIEITTDHSEQTKVVVPVSGKVVK